MPWKIRRSVYLILFGIASAALAVIVIVRNQSGDDEMLGVIGLLGSFAMIVVAIKWLTENGNAPPPH
jgi:hypothetical protein